VPGNRGIEHYTAPCRGSQGPDRSIPSHFVRFLAVAPPRPPDPTPKRRECRGLFARPPPDPPPVLVLVDACNVLHVEGALPGDLAGVDLGDLADLVARSRYRHDEVVLVMDGPTAGLPLPPSASRIRAIASGRGRTADEVIVDRLERSSAPRSVVVVTSDNAIRRRARRRRCRLVHSETFLAQLGRDAGGGDRRRSSHVATPPSASTRAWLREFGLDEEGIARLVGPPDGAAAPKAPTSKSPASKGQASESNDIEDPDRSPGDARTSAATDGANAADGGHTTGDVSGAAMPEGEKGPDRPRPRPRRRALEDARSLEEIDPRELERFDMGEWIDPPPPSNMPDDPA